MMLVIVRGVLMTAACLVLSILLAIAVFLRVIGYIITGS